MNDSTQRWRFSWQIARSRWVLIATLLGLLSIGSTCIKRRTGGGGDLRQYYLLGFQTYLSNLLVVRWSPNGQRWSSGEFPLGSLVGQGVGAVSYPNGAQHIMFWVDSQSRLQIQRGLGTRTWADDPQGPTLPQRVTSAPTVAYAGDGQYLVAFRAVGGAVSVRVLDEPSDWLSDDLGPSYGTNSAVLGRPAIAVVNSTVVLAWLRTGALTLAVGNVVLDPANPLRINWTRQSHDFDVAESGYGGPREMALTHDGSRFYLGVVRRTSFGELRHDALFIYTSDDGAQWAHLTQTLLIPLSSKVSIAARSDGSILATFVVSPSKRAVRLFQGTWTQLDADRVFGTVSSDKHIALISNVP